MGKDNPIFSRNYVRLRHNLYANRLDEGVEQEAAVKGHPRMWDEYL
jgi:hypothetical protein